MRTLYSRSDYAMELLVADKLITFDDIIVDLKVDSESSSQYRYVISTQGIQRSVMNREQLIDAYAEGRLKFYGLVHVGSELDSALFDYD